MTSLTTAVGWHPRAAGRILMCNYEDSTFAPRCRRITDVCRTLPAAQDAAKPKPEDTEVWKPVPPVVTPGATNFAPPSDAIVLFDGKNRRRWVSAQDHRPPSGSWPTASHREQGKGVGNIETDAASRTTNSMSSSASRKTLPAAARRAATAACFSPPPGPATMATSCRSGRLQ